MKGSLPRYPRLKLIVIIAALVVIGFSLRFYLSSRAPNYIIFDMSMFHEYALELLTGKTPIDCCNKNFGYMVFLAFIYKIFGVQNLFALRGIQICLDMVSAIIVFRIAYEMFGIRSAIFSFFLFVINPFTSAYTGLRLPENLTIFYLMSIIFVISRVEFAKQKFLWGLFGFLLGILLFTRLQFYYFGFTLILLFLYRIKHWKNKLYYLVISLFFLILGNTYSIIVNYQTYHVVSVTPPYSLFTSFLYFNFYGERYPELTEEVYKWNTPVSDIMRNYRDLSSQLDKIPPFRNNLTKLFWQRLKYDFPLFLYNTVQNMIWIWDKRFLFVYEDPFIPKYIFLIRSLNIGVLALFWFGMYRFMKQKIKKIFQNPVFIFSVFLFFYITFLFALASSETRHTIIYYPILFLWGGYGMEGIITFIYHIYLRYTTHI